MVSLQNASSLGTVRRQLANNARQLDAARNRYQREAFASLSSPDGGPAADAAAEVVRLEARERLLIAAEGGARQADAAVAAEVTRQERVALADQAKAARAEYEAAVVDVDRLLGLLAARWTEMEDAKGLYDSAIRGLLVDIPDNHAAGVYARAGHANYDMLAAAMLARGGMSLPRSDPSFGRGGPTLAESALSRIAEMNRGAARYAPELGD